MNMKTRFAAGLLALAPALAWGNAGYLDLYYVPSAEFETATGSDDGDGFGAKMLAPVGDGVLLSGEYQTSDYDDSGIESKQFRVGLAFMGGDVLRFGVLGEYVDAELELPGLGKLATDGYGLHGRLELAPSENLSLYGQGGVVKLKDDDGDRLDGPEYLVGLALALDPATGLFVEHRSTTLEDNDGDEIEFTDLRIGLRLQLGR